MTPNMKHVHQMMNVPIKQTQIMTEIDEFLKQKMSFLFVLVDKSGLNAIYFWLKTPSEAIQQTF